LDAGGNALFAEIEALIARFPPYSDEREQFSAALYSTSEVLKIDGEGRVMLTEPLKTHAGIADAVAFAGRGHKFQIWEPRRFGAGGLSRAILDATDCRVIGIDRDPSALAHGTDLVEASNGRLTLVEDRFSNLADIARGCGHDVVDGVVLDLGVSSMQLDQAAR